MFSRLTSLFAQAAEATTQALTGQQSSEEELQGHWKTIQSILISEGGESTGDDLHLIKEIEGHLDSISDLICTEEEERKGTMGPCMEYLLRHKILDMLVTTAKTDYPAGMRKTVFNFLTVLLGRIDQQLLPHVAVHRPVNQLIKTCGLTSSNPLAAEEMTFLRILCLKLKQDTTLVNFFIEVKDDGKETKFVISEAFMRITISEDSLVCIKAFECLLLCTSLPDPVVTQAIASSQFPLLLSSKLRQHLQLLPNTLHYTDILNCKAGWGVNNASTSAIQCLSPVPQKPLLHLEAYLSWLDYCEQIVAESPQPLGNVVCQSIREQVMEGTIQQKLSLSSEPDLIIGVAVLNQSVKTLTHKRLRQEFTDFILTCFWELLIQCCSHLNEDVCCSSLLLVHTLLSLPHLLPQILPSVSPPSGKERSVVSIMEQPQLEEHIKRFLSVVPSGFLSANEVGGDSGLTHYLLDAHEQVGRCQKLSKQWECQTEQMTTPIRQENVSGSANKWEEPPLITALLDRLERLLDQNYEVNLYVTQILSLLAASPLPLLDLHLFSTDDDHTSSRTVYGVLKKVQDQLIAHSSRSPGLQFNIVEARRRLAGQETSDLLSMPNNELLEGAVVLEEFTKELAAILYLKHSQVLLTTPPMLPQEQTSSQKLE